MSSLLDKTEFTQEYILGLIASRTEESINIDFKDARALSSGDGKEISKDVSAFANSDGGLIFYGINEENHVATGTSFVDGNKYNKEWLENKITSNIQQRIQNLLIIPVRFDNDIMKTVYVVKIPKSPNSPHLNGDNKYYRRFNFKSVPMEEYEVRDSYLRVSASMVKIDSFIVQLVNTHNINRYEFKIEVLITNTGNNVAEKYKVAAIINTTVPAELSATNPYSLTNNFEDGRILSTNVVPAIFPSEKLNILTFNLAVRNENISKFTETSTIEFTVFNQGSIKKSSNNQVIEQIKKLVESND
ncbi:AlbA family DNA-binding domain-containing protein [Flavobacterium tructae]|uniref:Schlafen AlbA-2 domain-containing protein n=1 Tax=Flavobacterium tructae TaxID=1114873 RepID=A0A1S1J5X7_9FLAO|nr:ATP-binding protein [Flavobacterium tructae]OHT43683.1 hypothetical protein BHE19_18100 [Flavobacterium tructae]OXB18933.1 hypothetical protein B0A71_13880 [Flavobacterium tructae]